MTSRPPAYLASFPGCQNEHRQLLLRRWAAGNRREQRAGRAIKFVIGNPDVVEPRVALGGTADIKRGAIIGNFGKTEKRFRVSPQLEGVSKDLLPDRFRSEGSVHRTKQLAAASLIHAGTVRRKAIRNVGIGPGARSASWIQRLNDGDILRVQLEAFADVKRTHQWLVSRSAIGMTAVSQT